MMKNILILAGILHSGYCACVYPSDLIGDWYSTSFGTLTFSSQSFSGFTSDLSTALLTFTCYESSGSLYVSKWVAILNHILTILEHVYYKRIEKKNPIFCWSSCFIPTGRKKTLFLINHDLSFQYVFDTANNNRKL